MKQKSFFFPLGLTIFLGVLTLFCLTGCWEETPQSPAAQTQPPQSAAPRPEEPTAAPQTQTPTQPTGTAADPETAPGTTSSPAEPDREGTSDRQTASGPGEELAAAAVLAVSMAYPDFTLNGIYAESDSGVYVLFRSGGRDLAVESRLLKGERTQPGTRDISAAAIGFASFDEVPVSGVSVGELAELTLEDLEQALAQSLLVSLYER